MSKTAVFQCANSCRASQVSRSNLNFSSAHVGKAVADVLLESRRTQVTPSRSRGPALHRERAFWSELMKTLLVVLCLLCASVAWGQATAGTSALIAEPQITQFYSHPQHASQTGMGI